MQYGKRVRGAAAWMAMALATTAGGAVTARAAAIDYTVNFTGSSGDPLPVGSFTYDAAVPAFTNFIVQWEGLTFDLTSSANSPLDDGPTGPACLGGLTGAAAGFAWLNPGCQTFPTGWAGDTTPVSSNIFASFNFVEQDSSTQIGEHGIVPDTAIDDDTDASGAFTISPAATAAPEPATLGLLSGGLGLVLLLRRRRARD